MDTVDNVIWILPFLAVLDVVSTFYAESQDFLLDRYEAGFFASLAVQAGDPFIYIYAVIYVLIIAGFSFALWYIKKRLDPSISFDKLFYIVLIAVAGYIYLTISAAFITNFFLPLIVARGVSLFNLRIIIYLFAALSLIYYIWRDAVAWLRSEEEHYESGQQPEAVEGRAREVSLVTLR